MNTLKGKVAVITGASKGIGKSIASTLAREGCHVALVSRSESGLESATEELAQTGAEVLRVRADVRKIEDVERFVSQVEKRFGAAHILVNNAGIGIFSNVVEMSEEDFRAVLETNLFGVFYCTKLVLPMMIRQQEGHIINISSLASKNNFSSGSAYCASKHALNSFAECLMLEVRHHNIKVTTICPGSVQTDFSTDSKNKSWALTAEDVSKTVVDVLTSSASSLVSLMDLRPLKPAKR
jgi:3-oxoacyl-[acyl-carrier protein] reductase